MKINIKGTVYSFNVPFKAPEVRINLSSTFPVRSKCRFCMGAPKHYFAQKMPIRWWSPRRIQEMAKHASKYINRMCEDFYFIESPKEFIGTIAFNYTHANKSFNPANHTKRGTMAYDSVIEYLSCDCGRSSWAFTQKSSILRDEIVSRKARYKYPQKFEDWF